MRIHETNPTQGIDSGDVSAGTLMDWRARSRALENISMFVVPLGGELLWTIGDRLAAVKVTSVSPTAFAALGVEPLLGRSFTTDADKGQGGGIGQFVISYGLWQNAFGGAPDVIGRRILVEGRLPREIIGVMPRGFSFPQGTDAWVARPLRDVPVADRRLQSGPVLARLAPGATIDAARRELRGISRQLAAEFPASNAGWGAEVEPLAGADAKSSRLALLILMSAVAGVLLIGCANVANLLLARALSRRREVSVRMALGAGTLRVLRLIVAEAALLATAGIGLGMLIGHWIAAGLVRLAPPDIPRIAEVQAGGLVVLFAAIAGVCCAVLTSVAPGLQTIRTERHGGLRPDCGPPPDAAGACAGRSSPAKSRSWCSCSVALSSSSDRSCTCGA